MPDIINKPGQSPAALAAPAKAKAVKPRVMWRTTHLADDSFCYDGKSRLPTDRPVLVLDLASASVEALRVKLDQAFTDNGFPVSAFHLSNIAIKSLGLTQPAKRRRSKS